MQSLPASSGLKGHGGSAVGEAQLTVRNAGQLLVQRAIYVAAGLLFAALVPRLMGPELYGRYALATSLSMWFVLFSGLGFTQVITRFVPQFTGLGDTESVKGFLRDLLTVRLTSGSLSAGMYLLLTALWLRDIDLLMLALLAAAVLARSVGNLFYALFLGMNRAARWGVGDTIRGWVLLGLLVPGFLMWGLLGAFLAVLLTELVVLLVSVGWSRPFLSGPSLRLDVDRLLPYLRFGLIFFASDLLFAAFNHSGEALVRAISGDYAQVSYFALAYSLYFAVALTIPQFTLSFAPLLTSLLARGETEAVRQWTERLIKWTAVGGVLAISGAFLLGEYLVPLVLGAAYRPVATNLLPLTLALAVQSLSSVANLLALTCDRPRVTLVAAGLRLAAYWGFGFPLILWQGSLGGCLSVLAASTLATAYSTWRMRQIVRYSLRSWGLVVGLGGLMLPLAWMQSSWMVNVALYAAFVAAYGSLLFLLRVITPDEIATAWRAIGPRGWALRPTASRR